MSERDYKTNFPKHIPFSDYNLEEQERLLAISPIFRREGLTLYCGVPANDLRRYGPAPRRDCQMGMLDYVICQGETVILAVEIEDRDSWREHGARVPEVPYVFITAEEMGTGDCRPILSKLRELTDKGRQASWRMVGAANIQELMPKFLRWQMLQRTDGGWEPTEYGMYRGLVKQISSTGQVSVRCSELSKRLFEMTAEKYEAPAEQSFRKALQERISDFQKGLRSNPETSLHLVKELRDMPLATLMEGGYIEMENRLRENLPRSCETVGEAVLAIRDMLYSGDEESFDRGTALLRDLGVPAARAALLKLSEMPGAQLRPDIQELLHCVDEAQAKLRNRKFPGPGLDQRLARLGGRKALGEQLGLLPLMVFFQGVARFCRMEYPVWVGKQIQKIWSLAPDYPYGEMVHSAGYWIVSQSEAATEEDRKTGAYMLCLLMVEPIYLMEQMKHPEIYDKELN